MISYRYCFVLYLCLVACSAPNHTNKPQPPEINYGLDICESCGMLIDEPKFAAATLLTNSETRKFDDIGDMLLYHMDHPDLQVEAYFVHDYNSENWLRGEAAFYVLTAAIDSPMGHGVAAFELEEEAIVLAEEGDGDVLTFDQLQAAIHASLHTH